MFVVERKTLSTTTLTYSTHIISLVISCTFKTYLRNSYRNFVLYSPLDFLQLILELIQIFQLFQRILKLKKQHIYIRQVYQFLSRLMYLKIANVAVQHIQKVTDTVVISHEELLLQNSSCSPKFVS